MFWDTRMVFHPCAAHWITAQTSTMPNPCEASASSALLIAQVVNGEESEYLCDPVSCTVDRYTPTRLVSTPQHKRHSRCILAPYGTWACLFWFVPSPSSTYTSPLPHIHRIHTHSRWQDVWFCVSPSFPHTTLKRVHYLSSVLLGPSGQVIASSITLSVPCQCGDAPMECCTSDQRAGES